MNNIKEIKENWVKEIAEGPFVVAEWHWNFGVGCDKSYTHVAI